MTAAARAAPGSAPQRSGVPDRPIRVATVVTRLEGGAGVLALRGAQVIGRESFQPTIVTGSGDGLLAEAAESGIEVVLEPALRAPIALRTDLLALRRLDLLFRQRAFQVVHTHCAKAGTVGRMAARRAGVPWIVHTFHGFPFHQFQSAPRRNAYVSIERHLGRFTDLALCVGSGVAAEAVARELIAPDRVRTIGVIVGGPERIRASMAARDPVARRRARAALGLPVTATVVGAVGRLTYQKAPEDFVDAIAELGRPDVIGIWIGGGDLAERVARRASGGGARQPARIMLAGERTDILDVLPALDVFVLPSRYEGLPTAIVEAMICGVPVVATSVNAVPDLVLPGSTGLLVPPRRPRLLASAIRSLLDSPEAAARMAETAHARVADRYGQQDLRDALVAAYVCAASADAVRENVPA